ncbi:MAG TPA: YXWGXW repeat-containing protein [Gemmatimonadales bacterium]|nr:YXWGXW repeat-containing protein [Gemmatimonadales bacterium]
MPNIRSTGLVFSLSAALLVGAFACAPPPPPGAVFVARRPPDDRVEVVGVAPGPGYVWIAGNWRWERGDYVWGPGHWAVAERGYHRWEPGHWRHARGGWYWIDGRWS